MKNLNRKSALLILSSLVFLMSIQIVTAQESRKQGPPSIPDQEQITQMVDKLSKELDLTDDKTKQITKKYENHFNDIKKMMEDGRPERSVMEKMKSDFETDVKSILTDEQKKKFDKFLKNHNKRPKR